MGLGMTLTEYEAGVGPRNKHFHEAAERVRLSKQGVVPVDEDDRDDELDGVTDSYSPDDVDTDVETHGRGS